jgi:AAA+ ATPase superfamily predicted ATPase
MGLVRREIPFAESEKKSRRSLYKIDDPFFRLWFRVVAPHRGLLAASDRGARLELLKRFWPHLLAVAWEELCRKRVPRLDRRTTLAELGPWGAASRWWQGALPEWDLVSQTADGRKLLLGECKLVARPWSAKALVKEARAVAGKPLPFLPPSYRNRQIVRALFVPAIAPEAPRSPEDVLVVTCSDLLM